MKFSYRFWLTIAVVFVCVSVWPVFGQTDEATTEEESAIPGSTDMTLGVKDDKYVMPEGFRGKESGDGDLQWLEDVGYLMQENSNLYNVDAAAIAESAKFESEPNINWEVKKEDDSGNLVTQSSENTNAATNSSNITDPGYYQVHNGGARLVSTAGGAEEDDVGDSGGEEDSTAGSEGSATTSTSTSTGTGTGTDGEDDGAGAAGEEKTVTAQQRIGIQVHDCTSPDIWVAFQEGAGSIDMAATEEVLKAQMASKILENFGQPFSTDVKDYEAASYIFLEEGQEGERNRIPWEKTARLSIAGTLFNERGSPKFESGKLTAKIDQESYNNHVNVVGGEEKSLKGVYVRRNVPFIFAAVSTDNGNKRATAGQVTARIENADGDEIAKVGASYLFRVPNYPREEYQEQPDYYFSTIATDKDGNLTTIRMPLYVVNTQAAFEGGKNR
ncbi:MAG: hypothetical protein KKB51_14240 [Candidatus Riflebacteria bacterium]|nr:hypothetical protein [Candidatus Riflebacteria bacterium]